MKGVVHFSTKGKLNPQYVGPYVIVERVGPVAYRLDLPIEMQGIHNVFHASTLKKSFEEKRTVVMKFDEIQLQPNLSYSEWLVQIMDRTEYELRNRKIPLVKVLWNNPEFEEATWKREDTMRNECPYLFID
ncbi:uncharacterized protein LOC121249414 [Juglans microcarpa x Juglans regia]|uniref:uncharacterized protein LOC121249414 n=1 Tax=Juglans microcarpa x Juglans regia TaxID=2249226 RepID=UPI001B7E7F71|nr:uncharacterized protein LOC121249414 [Juglans microcarpa x Juglans regia]